MWTRLWTQFNNLAEELTAPDADWVNVNAIQKTIIWQLVGHSCYVPNPIQPNDLQLPELYSGSPWLTDQPWIAFVTLNPSIDGDEIFPTRAMFKQFAAANNVPTLVGFFNERFCFARNDVPLRHGRTELGAGRRPPTKWIGPQNRPRAVPKQTTWANIERALRDCLSGHALAGEPELLGNIAAIVDSVPWKFAGWGCVPDDIRRKLLIAGSPYLKGTLTTHPPNAIITCGSDLQFDRLPRGHWLRVLPDGDGSANRRVIRIGGQVVPCFNVSAPTAHGGAFKQDMLRIAEEIRHALGIQ